MAFSEGTLSSSSSPFSVLALLFSIACWYIFTTYSTIYAKSFLDARVSANSALTLTSVSLAFCPLTIALIVVARNIRALFFNCGQDDCSLDAGSSVGQDDTEATEMMEKGKFLSDRHNTQTVLTRRSFEIKDYRAIVCVALFHLGNTFLTNASLKLGDIKLIYTIKAAEPLMTILLMALLTRTLLPLRTICSLVPIPVGVLLATSADLSANPATLFSAFFSVVITSARSVAFKKPSGSASAAKKKSTIEEIERYLVIGTVAFILTLPLSALHAATPYQDEAVLTADESIEGSTKSSNLKTLLMGGLCHFLYNLFSFDVLARLDSPLTHSLLNVAKRITTVLASILYFRNKVSVTNVVGIVIANIGVLTFIVDKQRGKRKDGGAGKDDLDQNSAKEIPNQGPGDRVRDGLAVATAILVAVVVGWG